MVLAPKSWVPIFKSGASLTNTQVCDPPGRSITCIPGCTMDSTGPVAWCSPTSDGGYCPWKPVSPPGLNDYKNVKFILCKYALARAPCSKSVYTCANSLSWHTDVHFLWVFFMLFSEGYLEDGRNRCGQKQARRVHSIQRGVTVTVTAKSELMRDFCSC